MKDVVVYPSMAFLTAGWRAIKFIIVTQYISSLAWPIIIGQAWYVFMN